MPALFILANTEVRRVRELFALFLASIGTCAGLWVLGFCATRNDTLLEFHDRGRYSGRGGPR